VLACDVREGAAFVQGHQVALEGPASGTGGLTQIGIRPEFVTVGRTGLPAIVRKVMDVGRHAVIEAMLGTLPVKAVTDGIGINVGDSVGLSFQPAMTRLYRDGRIATTAGGQS
jgi:glycerol transport system ATP-binding protein